MCRQPADDYAGVSHKFQSEHLHNPNQNVSWLLSFLFAYFSVLLYERMDQYS
jgi:hypothetical protein